MRTRKRGRWLGRVVAVAAFSVAATFGGWSTATADSASDGSATTSDSPRAPITLDDTSWN
jgi:hypothetical protein